MKGIAHFACGVAAASLFPDAVTAAIHGNPLYMLAGGICGILPDTLDFKLARYLCRHDMEIAPDPLRPDPCMVANALKMAIERTACAGTEMCVKLHTVRLARDRWLAYNIEFDRSARVVRVCFLNEVDTGGNVLFKRSNPQKADVGYDVDVSCEYGGRVTVGFLEGPTILFKPVGNRVEAVLIHWHRTWSHSLLFAAVLGLAGAAWGGLTMAWVCCAAAFLHIIADQAGFMGGCLWYPFSKTRVPGYKLAGSGDPHLNFALVWLSCLVTIWNAGGPEVRAFGLLHYAFWSGIVPLVIAFACLKRT